VPLGSTSVGAYSPSNTKFTGGIGMPAIVQLPTVDPNHVPTATTMPVASGQSKVVPKASVPCTDRCWSVNVPRPLPHTPSR
jgi:hypothetical protein